ncbi:hypothetical protein V6Z05_19995 [Leptospira venezuelensis]|uniref:hypothetical protein n=1 Tax=Leptospira venezuelensis TaxID=1958811 RepID=UPI000A3A2FFB|nr:hypothetical protein [Leptospira venezuelensis]
MNEPESRIAKYHSLHKYFIHSDRMRILFENILKDRIKSGETPSFGELMITDFIYLNFWYSSLYVIVEGWMEHKLEDKTINDLLKSPNLEKLRRFRNGVFHYQKDYFDSRFMDFIRSDENPVDWVRRLHKAFSDWFLLKEAR